MIPASLLVIARSQSLARRLQDAVGADEIRTQWLPSTASALSIELTPVVIVVELPDSGGERTLGRLRRRFDAPLLVLLRSGQALPPGAQVTLLRPFPMTRLAHLVREMLHQNSPGILQVGGLSLDTQNRRLQVGVRFHELRPIGCQILALLMETPGETLARDVLFRRIWNTEDGDSTRALDVHVSHLRRIIEDDPRHPRVLVTERGLGYRLEAVELP